MFYALIGILKTISISVIATNDTHIIEKHWKEKNTVELLVVRFRQILLSWFFQSDNTSASSFHVAVVSMWVCAIVTHHCAPRKSLAFIFAYTASVGKRFENCKERQFQIIVFCCQNCSDLMWEKIVLVLENQNWNLRLRADI